MPGGNLFEALMAVDVVPSGNIHKEETGAGVEVFVICTRFSSQKAGTVKSVL